MSAAESDLLAPFRAYVPASTPAPLTCDACALTFENRWQRSAHTRYKHGAGLRKPLPDGTPAPAPAKPVPAAFAPAATKVPVKAVGLPWVSFPRDPRLLEQLAATIESVTPLEDGPIATFWRSLRAHCLALTQLDARESAQQSKSHGRKVRYVR